MRARDVKLQSEQWRFGDAPDDTNHTRIIDLFWPADAATTQEELLSSYPPSQETNMDNLAPGACAQLPMLRQP
jgi:hypothetical protein